MTGCKHNAKNTLTKNYLYLAEKNGARVYPLTTVTSVEPLPAGPGTPWTQRYLPSARRRGVHRRAGRVRRIGPWDQKLLHRLQDERQTAPACPIASAS